MIITIEPGAPIRGNVHLAGDKSLSHRAALLAGMAKGESQIDNFLDSGVTRPLLSALSGLGVEWTLSRNQLTVSGKGYTNWRSTSQAILCGGSATTLRLLAGAMAAAGVGGVLDGSEGLRRRPMGRILEPLRAMGVGIQGSEGDTAPLILQERPPRQSLLGREHYLAVASAQVKSCVLLAGLAADGPTTIIEPGPSRDHTERFLRSLGMTVQQECQVRSTTGDLENCYWTRLYPPETPDLPPLRITLPGDISSAAFLLVAGLLTPGSEITVENVVLNPTRTGLLEVLQAMGADLQVSIQGEMAGEPVGNITARSSLLNATRVEGAMVVRMIDEFPIFAVAAAFAIGETRVRNAEELRTKESDRIGSLCAEIRALGGQAEETPDGFVIQGNGDPLAGGRLDAHGDHRLAMAGMVAGLAAQGPVSVLGAEAFSESFPGFPQILRQMGGRVIDEQ